MNNCSERHQEHRYRIVRDHRVGDRGLSDLRRRKSDHWFDRAGCQCRRCGGADCAGRCVGDLPGRRRGVCDREGDSGGGRVRVKGWLLDLV